MARGRPPKKRKSQEQSTPDLEEKEEGLTGYARLEPMYNEIRKFPRVEVALTADLKTKFIYATGQVLNLSLGGLFIKTSRPLPAGETIDVILHLPDEDEPIQVSAQVCWVREQTSPNLASGMGLSMTGAPEDTLQKIERYLASCPKNI